MHDEHVTVSWPVGMCARSAREALASRRSGVVGGNNSLPPAAPAADRPSPAVNVVCAVSHDTATLAFIADGWGAVGPEYACTVTGVDYGNNSLPMAAPGNTGTDEGPYGHWSAASAAAYPAVSVGERAGDNFAGNTENDAPQDLQRVQFSTFRSVIPPAPYLPLPDTLSRQGPRASRRPLHHEQRARRCPPPTHKYFW